MLPVVTPSPIPIFIVINRSLNHHQTANAPRLAHSLTFTLSHTYHSVSLTRHHHHPTLAHIHIPQHHPPIHTTHFFLSSYHDLFLIVCVLARKLLKPSAHTHLFSQILSHICTRSHTSKSLSLSYARALREVTQQQARCALAHCIANSCTHALIQLTHSRTHAPHSHALTHALTTDWKDK